MVTALAHGTVFVIRHNNFFELWCVHREAEFCGYTTVKEPLGVGDVVHRCVWKGNSHSAAVELVSRETYTVEPGDVVWKNTGLQSLVNGKPIFRNEFRGGPRWVREAQ